MENNRSINPSRNQEYQTADVDVVLTRKEKKKQKEKRRKLNLIPALFLEMFEEELQNIPR